MTWEDRWRKNDLERLTEQLKQVAEKRLVETFKNPDGRDEAVFSIIARITKAVFPDMWDETPTHAVIRLMRVAVSRLPEERPQHFDVTWRSMGTLLYGLRKGLGRKPDGTWHSYTDYIEQLKKEANFYASGRTFGRRTAKLREMLAEELLKMEVAVNDGALDLDEAIAVADRPSELVTNAVTTPAAVVELQAEAAIAPVSKVDTLKDLVRTFRKDAASREFSSTRWVLLRRLFTLEKNTDPAMDRPVTFGQFATAISMVVVLIAAIAIAIQLKLVTREHSAANSPETIVAGGPFTPPPLLAVTATPQEKFDNAHGWGPPRPTFTIKDPPSYAVFNSIIDAPKHGDERNLTQCHDKAEQGSWGTELVAHDGHTYECFIWFANDVAPHIDGSDPAYQLHNARVRVLLPPRSTYNPGIVAILSAENAGKAWSSCNFLAARRMSIDYVPGTARMFTAETADSGLQLAEVYEGDGLADGITGPNGSRLGESEQDGVLRQKPGYVLFDIKITIEAQ